MAESSREKSSARSSTPATAAPMSAPAVPQHTGNAAAQARLGLAAPVPTAVTPVEGGMTMAALVAMGDMGAVVLDALPLKAAMRLAMGLRGTPWAEAWVCAQPVADLVRQVPELVAAGFDRVWPVGTGIEFDQAASASHLVVTGGECAAIGLTRTAEGMDLTVKAGWQAGLTAGIGTKMSGSTGDTALGADLSASLGGAATYEMKWALALPSVIGLLSVRDPRLFYGMVLRHPIDLPQTLRDVVTSLAETQPPTSWSGDFRGIGEASGVVATGGLGSLEGGAKLDAGIRIGREGGESYLEASMGGGQAGVWDNKLLQLMRKLGLPEMALSAGSRLRIRVSGAAADINVMNFEKLCFTIATTRSFNGSTVEDAFETSNVGAAIRWMTTLANPADECFGEDGPSVSSRDLPDVALRRSTTRSVADVSEITDPSVVVELLEILVPARRAFMTANAAAELTGELYVPIEAVHAALHGTALPSGPEGIEARVLEVERAIAAKAVGGSFLLPDDLAEIDLDAGAGLVELPKVEAVVKHVARAGMGGEVKLAVAEEINVNLGLTLTERITLSPAIETEQRRALFAS